MAETDKPSALEARLQAARERRQRQEKERADRKTEMASKLEETEKRRQELVNARDAKIEAKKEHAMTRHEEAQKRREVQMRVRREKLLNDVEKTDRLSREAKRRNRHSWGGNIHVEKSQCQMMVRTSAGGDDSPQNDRPRPTALSKPMQNWISGLRSYDGDEGDTSLNTSTHSSLNSPRGHHIVPERLLTPTAASKAKRHTPEGAAATTDDVGKVSEMGDGKLKRRTVSSMDINRLAQPKRSISKDRGAPDGGGSSSMPSSGTLTRARSIQNLSPRTKLTTRLRQSSFDNSPRTAPDGAPTNSTSRARRTSRESGGGAKKTTAKTVETPKPKAAAAASEVAIKTPKTVDKPKSTPRPKSTTTPMAKKETPLAKSTPKVQAAKQTTKQNVEIAPCDKFPCNKSSSSPTPATPPPLPSTSDLKKQLELEDLEDEQPSEVQLKIEEPEAPAAPEPVVVEPEIKAETTPPPPVTEAAAPAAVVVDDAVETRSGQSFPIAPPTKDFAHDERKPHDQSAGDLSIGSSEVVYEEAKGVKTLASKFNELKQESLTSLASESMTSMTSTDTEKEQKGDKSVHWPEDNDIEKVEQISPDEEKDQKPEKKKKKKKDKKKSKKDDSDESKSESKKKKKLNATKNSMIMGWLDNSGETEAAAAAENSEIVNTSATAPAPAADDKEDEYKRKLEEKKREHQRRKQEQEQLEQERLNQLEQQEHDKKKQREAELDAKFEEEKKRMEEKMSINLKKSLEEKEQKRKEEEEQRKARKDRIAAIMKRTREQNNAEQAAAAAAANNGVSSTPGSELVGLQRTTSSESGTGSVTDMSSRVGSLLGSIRAKTGQPASGGQQPQQQDPVNHAVPSVQ